MLNIIYVEDNPGDVFLTEEMLNELDLPYKLIVLNDGEKAINYFEDNKKKLQLCNNSLVILDINLPKVDGHSILYQIRKVTKLDKLKVLMVSSSKHEKNKICSDCCVQGFYEKPLEKEIFLNFLAFHF